MSRANTRMVRTRPAIDRFALIVLIVFIILAIVTSIVTFIWARSFFASWTMTDLGGAPPVLSNQTVNDPKTGKPVTTLDPMKPLDSSALAPTPQPWDGSSRVTILVMGLDYRDWEDGNDVARTDTMILFSIDPISKSAGMISIPRDMWVPITGMNGYNKINTAYRWGEIYQLPGGGPGLAMKTVEQFLGVPVNYYALLDFDSFVKFIDSMGGLSMHIRKEIVVDPIGPGNTRTLEEGVQTLDGSIVLAYARNRYTDGDDFDRSRRQHEVIMAIREQILTFNMLPTMIAKAPELYSEVASGIRTNLTLDQVIKLAWLASSIDEDNIKKGVIGPPNMIQYAKSPDGSMDILVPVPDQIRLLRDEIFATGGPVSPAAVAGNAEELMRAEKARVMLQNGTLTAGLASKTSEILKPLGVNIVGEGNAEQSTAQTTIYDYTGKPYTTRFLMSKLNIPDARVVNRFDPNASVDIVIVLGNDWASQGQ